MENIILIGTTNAGKSTLFNLLVEENASIVSNVEHLTRDIVLRKYNNKNFYDTPGLRDIADLDSLSNIVFSLDIICLVISTFEGLTKLHFDIIKKYRDKNLCVVYTKQDLHHQVTRDISGIKSFMVSMYDMKSIATLRKYLLDGIYSKPENYFQVAIFGRANVGKSTIANSILGRDRFLARDEIGTTLEVNQEMASSNSINFVLYDTPGYRKNKHLPEISHASQKRVMQHLQQKWSYQNLCLVVLDAKDNITKTDKKILDLACDAFKTLIVINKKDLISHVTLNDMIKKIQHEYKTFYVIAISALEKYDIVRLHKILSKSITSSMPIKISTPSLNQWLQSLNISYIKYGVHIRGVEFKIFSKKHPTRDIVAFMQNRFCHRFNLPGIRPIFEFVIS